MGGFLSQLQDTECFLIFKLIVLLEFGLDLKGLETFEV